MGLFANLLGGNKGVNLEYTAKWLRNSGISESNSNAKCVNCSYSRSASNATGIVCTDRMSDGNYLMTFPHFVCEFYK